MKNRINQGHCERSEAISLLAMTVSLALLLSGCAAPQKLQPILETIPPAELTWAEDLPIIHLSGSPYAMGYQHGSVLRKQVQASVANVMAFVNRGLGIPVVGGWLARRALDRAWAKMEPFIPTRYSEELEGLADGAGIPLKTLRRVHALPERMATTCASFAAFGQATQDGRMIQARNLDWAIRADVQRYAAVFVHRPAGRIPFVSAGWLGFMGVISGINRQGISVGEIGAGTADSTLEGIPMPFLLRRVLEESDRLDQAVSLVQAAPRTGGYNYLFADAAEKKAAALETTRRRCAVFWADQEGEKARDNPYAVLVPNAIFRSDWALDPEVRDSQWACGGNPKRPGLEPPIGSKAYGVRYWGQGQLIRRFYGKIDPETAMAIARAIAPSSNIQSVVYAFPEMWVANAAGRKAAALGKYVQLDLRDLLKKE